MRQSLLPVSTYLAGRTSLEECDHSTNLHLRQEGVPRTFKEIVAVSTVNKRDIGRCFKIILKWHEDTKVGLVDSGDFMSR